MSISLEDAQAFLTEAEHFSREKVAACSFAPELPVSLENIHTLSQEAAQLGLLPQLSGEGFALWEHTDSQGAMTFNLGLLQVLAEVNASLAFAWHKQALSTKLLKLAEAELSLEPLELTMLCVGRQGLGREQLGRYLSSTKDLPQTGQEFLQDWLDRDQAAVLIAPSQWQNLLWPVWKKGTLRWQLVQRDKLQVQSKARQHGFDELSAFLVSGNKNNHSYLNFSQDPKQLTLDILKQEYLGLLAIAVGSLKRAMKQTFEFTALRKQGGHAINRHPAILQMQAEISAVLQQAESNLQHFSAPLNATSLKQIMHSRMLLQPMLCHAASQCMQAHGGVGYMRDVGIEKAFREQNMLRVLGGGLLEIPLIINGLNQSEANQ